MPHFKTITVCANRQSLKVAVKINAAGEFYATLSDEYKPAINAAFDLSEIEYSQKDIDAGRIKVIVSTFVSLEKKLTHMLHIFSKPTITSTTVIRYNIETHVSFAEDQNGNIYPNAGYPGAEWTERDGRYGDHHAARPSKGGYILVIGADAATKTVTKYGDREEVSYKSYYKDGDHHGRSNPAELLNSWCSFSLGEDFNEIPYTDEAALFFHQLLMGMAQISKQIQDHTFNECDLLSSIINGSSVRMLTNAPK